MRHRKLKIIGLACTMAALAELLFAAFGRGLVPSRVTVHAPRQAVRSVTLDGQALPHSDSSDYDSPIFYGPHDLRVELADGKVAWAAFFHSDTGVVRRLDNYVSYAPSGDAVTFRETNTRYETFPGVTRTVFTGSTRPEDTSAARPLTLDWI